MVALGYPGEISGDKTVRMVFWVLSMLPFLFVVYSLVLGLGESSKNQPECVKGLVNAARYLTVVSWLTYPGVYLIKGVGPADSPLTTTLEQIGYSIADVVAKAVFGVLIWAIAQGKSDAEAKERLLA